MGYYYCGIAATIQGVPNTIRSLARSVLYRRNCGGSTRCNSPASTAMRISRLTALPAQLCLKFLWLLRLLIHHSHETSSSLQAAISCLMTMIANYSTIIIPQCPPFAPFYMLLSLHIRKVSSSKSNFTPIICLFIR